MELIEPNSKFGQIVDEAIQSAPILDEPSKTVRKAVTSVTGSSKLMRQIADLLHGTWLGHPLHAVLVETTIGAWTSGAMLDVAAAVTGSEDFETAADAVTTIGTASAVATALTGLNDYSRIKNDAARSGMVHGMLNSAALMSYAFSLVARKKGNRSMGLALSLTGLGIATLSAWIGGDMVYRHKVGVNHAVPPKDLDDWTPVMANSELLEMQAKRVEINDTPLLLYRRYGHVYVIGAVCSHAGGPLDEGTFEEYCVTCPWHDSVFDLRDGSVVHGPATMQEPVFDCRVNDAGMIEIRTRQ